MNIAKLAREKGIDPKLVYSRLSNGSNLEKALTPSKHKPAKDSVGKWFGEPIDGLPGTLYCRNLIAKQDKHSRAFVFCFCGHSDCREFFTARIDLVRDTMKSCGACRNDWIKLKRGEAYLNSIYRNYQHSAKKRKISFELPKRVLAKMIQKDCVYCGVKPSQDRTRHSNPYNGKFLYNGIDRIDSSKGYTVSNIVPCCGVCNMAKGKMAVDEFKSWIFKVAKHLSI
jgi:5-methylcytosine-specific restriction endonuclease McrA